MKGIKLVFAICVCSVILGACTFFQPSGNSSSTQVEYDEFYFITGPAATSEHSDINDIWKIVYLEFADMHAKHQITADLVNGELYFDVYSIAYTEPYILNEDDIVQLQDIISRNNVLDWNESYYGERINEGTDVLDAGGNYLYLQYTDGTVDYIKFNIYSDGKGFPADYDSFTAEALAFAEQKMKESLNSP